MKEITLNGVAIDLWTRELDSLAWQQINNISKLPFIHHHVALMADGHGGAGVPIGCVLPVKDVVIPNAIGTDCGCGMRAVKSDIKVSEISTDVLRKSIMRGIRKQIPIGDFAHKVDQAEEFLPQDWNIDNLHTLLSNNGIKKILRQIGTLGGGNHFIELQKDEEGYLWVMIHSGSRGVGGKLHQEYNQIAKNLNRKYFSMVPEEADLAFLPKNSAEFNMFWNEMNYCMEWAKCNRKLMMNRIIDVIKDSFPDATFENPIDIHHNYAAVEEHYSRQCIVHRKGAASAREGEIGIIPGSMGTCSYIVRGLGKPESFFSSSHGAGRAMSRGEAVATLDMKHEIDLLESQNIVHSIRNRNDLEEATSAYKNIDVVMTNQKDLVEIVTPLLPIAVIKG